MYRDETAPLASYYEDRGLLVSVDGTGGIEEVFERIVEVLESRARPA